MFKSILHFAPLKVLWNFQVLQFKFLLKPSAWGWCDVAHEQSLLLPLQFWVLASRLESPKGGQMFFSISGFIPTFGVPCLQSKEKPVSNDSKVALHESCRVGHARGGVKVQVGNQLPGFFRTTPRRLCRTTKSSFKTSWHSQSASQCYSPQFSLGKPRARKSG